GVESNSMAINEMSTMTLTNDDFIAALDCARDPRAEAVYRRLTDPTSPELAGGLPAGDGEVCLDGTWYLSLEARAPEMVAVAAEDLARFLAGAYNVMLAEAGSRSITVRIDPVKGRVHGRSKREHLLEITSEGITVTGASEWGGACGLYHLQRLLKLRAAPVLSLGTVAASPLLDPSLTYPAFKNDNWADLSYPEAYHDDYLARMARAGYTGFHLHLAIDLFFRSQVLPAMNRPDADAQVRTLAEIVRLARRRGLEVFLDAYTLPLAADHPVFAVHPALRGCNLVNTRDLHTLCSSQALTKRFYQEQFSRLFADVPGLAGVFLLTGCEGLLHCFTAPALRGEGHTDCPNCAGRDAEATVAELVNGIARAVKLVAPEALVTIWPYGAFTWAKTPDAHQHVASLSRDCAFRTHFDIGDDETRDGVTFTCMDYHLTCVGPSSVFTTQTEIARRHGLKTLAKLESGVSLEMVSVPCIPALTRWARKYAAVRHSGVSGAMFNWEFIGYTESLSSELAGFMSWDPCPEPEELLRRLAARDFGEENAILALAAWREFDRAMAHFPLSHFTYSAFKGPFYIGFTHPLIFTPLNPGELSPRFWLRSGSWGDQEELEGSCAPSGTPLFVMDLFGTQPFGAVKTLLALRKMERHWRRGCLYLSELTSGPTEYTAARVREHQALGEGIQCTLRTAINLVRFYLLRDELFNEPADARLMRKRLTALRNIAKEELANAERGLECLRANPLLGYDYIYHYGFTEEMALSKIAHTKRLIDFDLPFRQFNHVFCLCRRDEWIWDDGRKYR
ncbi:MAG TPA: hypothetical protein VGM23_08460, partial [Armatimonadota bacterium]